MSAETLSVLEDIYLPYQPTRRTRATIAREKGLEPLAEFILTQSNANLNDEAQKFISDEKIKNKQKNIKTLTIHLRLERRSFLVYL